MKKPILIFLLKAIKEIGNFFLNFDGIGGLVGSPLDKRGIEEERTGQ